MASRDTKGSSKKIKIDLHCHSDVSDGYYPPHKLAEIIAGEGAGFAALTDHSSTEGYSSFKNTAIKCGLTVLSGIELHALFDGAEIHLLVYNFNPQNSGFNNILKTLPDVYTAINTAHKAGGLVFLAHPLNTPFPGYSLDEAAEKLARAGLDGLEVYYKGYTKEEQEKLSLLADKLGLITCGGSDFHGPLSAEKNETRIGADLPCVEVPLERWKEFRNALGNIAGSSSEKSAALPLEETGREAEKIDKKYKNIDWKKLALKIALPSLLVLIFFIVLIFAVIIPETEHLLLDRKRDVVIELTNIAWSILDDYNREVINRNISLEDAQHAAAEQIRHLRYGPEDIDYFWITDMHPIMIMHPYRSDLEGSDLSAFTDPDEVRPFVKFVKTVKEHSSGFVRYVWQWHDDPGHMASKESYVRGFKPWGWIIGTGLYVDDVRKGIDSLTGRMIDAAFIVTILASLLLFIVVWQSFRTERSRSEAVQELRCSHERYRALVESSSSGTLLLVDGKCAYANKKLLTRTGYTSDEIVFLDLNDIIISENNTSEPCEARLKFKNGKTAPVMLSSAPVAFSGIKGELINIQEISLRRVIQSETEREKLASQLQTSLLFLTEPVSKTMDKPVSCLIDTPVSRAVSILTRNNTDAIIVTGYNRELIGIVTDSDIRKRAVFENLDTSLPVSRIMTSPLITIDESAPLFEALMIEHERNISCLAATDSSGHLSGIIKSSRAFQPDRYAPFILIRRIRQAESVEELETVYQQLPALAGSLFDAGALPQNLCHMTSTAADAAVRQVISFAEAKLGPAPAEFAFIALGSQARKEQTLAADQDNAIIYDDSSDTNAACYFLEFGKLVCSSLDRSGWSYCKGGNMAANPEWNQPLSVWKEYFSKWITEPYENALAFFNVFFDWSCVYGDIFLADKLRTHIYENIEKHPAFLSYMAINAVRYKPPMGIFGRIVTGSSGETRNKFNIKDSILPVVNFARLYSLQQHTAETTTLNRLENLYSCGILNSETYRSVSGAYTCLMQMRFQHQIECLKKGLPVDNLIDPAELTHLETGMLKNAFSQISVIQKKAAYDFHVPE